MNDSKKVTPYNSQKSKKEQVAEMFDNISGNYDFLNHFLSLGIDIGWRKKAIKLLSAKQPKRILDVATGTADFALMAKRLNPSEIIGVDISNKMLEVGRVKVKERSLDKLIDLRYGDSENLPFESDYFDAITVAFGVRNFENLNAGLTEMARVLKPGGQCAVIEFSKPRKFPIKQLYFFYFQSILPFIGKLVSKDARAYSYLPESVKAFPDNENFVAEMTKAGFKSTTIHPLTFGIASIYLATK